MTAAAVDSGRLVIGGSDLTGPEAESVYYDYIYKIHDIVHYTIDNIPPLCLALQLVSFPSALDSGRLVIGESFPW